MRHALRPLSPELEDISLRLHKALDVHPLVARLLVHRGLRDEDGARRFLNGGLADLPNPFLLPDMDRAIARILQAVQSKEKIVVFGDYDVDGITGTAQLLSYFREIGAVAEGLLPHRMHDGYGLTASSVRRIAAASPGLLITVDNGTQSFEEIAALRARGADVVVIDHHEAPRTDHRPDVAALVNPKAADSRFGERDIASAGLVFLLLMALRARSRELGLSPLPNLKRYLDLACLGTIADVVPLTGTNRILTRFGLEELDRGERPGLRALKAVAQVHPPATATTVAFRLAPRLNAAGRLSDPMLALNLLLASDDAEAGVLAQKLEDLNRERQKIEEKVTAEAVAQVEKDGARRHGLTAAGEGWHLGVVGIVAAKLTERFGRPAVALAILEDPQTGRVAKGSARTVGRFSVHQALQAVAPEMLKFGGHAAAAGLTVSVDNLARFAERFDEAVRSLWSEEHTAQLEIDSILNLADINSALVRQLALLEPHGAGNPEPVFLSESVRFEGCRVVKNAHLKAQLCQEGARIEAIGFNWAPYLEKALKIASHRVTFCPQMNIWNGIESVQMKIKSIDPN